MSNFPCRYPAALQTVVADLLAMQADTGSCVHHRLALWLVDWLLNNRRYRAEVEDVGYDRSTRAVRSEDGFRLEDYGTIGDLLDSEFTGKTIATYCSGSGLAAETLHEAAIEIAGEALRAWIEVRLPGIYDFGDDGALSQDHGFDSDDLCEALSDIGSEYGFVDVFKAQPLFGVFSKHLPAALALRANAVHQAV